MLFWKSVNPILVSIRSFLESLYLCALKQPNVLIAHPANKDQMGVIKAFFEALEIKFEVAEKSPYEPEFVSKIQKSRKQAREGKTVKITLDEIWK